MRGRIGGKRTSSQESNKLLHFFNNEGTCVVCFSAFSPSVNKITDQKLKWITVESKEKWLCYEMNNLVFNDISYSKRGRGCHGWMMSPQLPACFVRAFLIQKHFYCLTNQTKEERKLDRRDTRLTFPRYC